MKQGMLVGVVCVLLAGCDYTVPLVKTPEAGIDAALVGLWQRSVDGKVEQLLALPLGTREYLVVYPAGSKDAMFARACFWRGAGLTLVQLDWFGTARGRLPENNRTFQYVACALEGDSVALRLLNPEIVTKDAGSPDALAEAITANKDNPRLFRDAMVFQRAPR